MLILKEVLSGGESLVLNYKMQNVILVLECVYQIYSNLSIELKKGSNKHI